MNPLVAILVGALMAGVESNPRHPNRPGDHGRAHGPLQITAGVVCEVNEYAGTHFRISDADDPASAKQICVIYEGHWATRARLGHEPTLEDMARIWNGGPNGWRRSSTLAYWAKVRAAIER